MYVRQKDAGCNALVHHTRRRVDAIRLLNEGILHYRYR